MDAFFFLDKPSWMTSFDVLRDMRHNLNIKKIGHTGTLDPLATGGLLVATWNYTKLIPYIEKDSKKYIANIMLDGKTESYDSDTEIHFVSSEKKQSFQKELTQEKLENIFKKNFSGKITQIPPKYSALKINGKRALDRTLAGENIKMNPRDAEIFLFKIISYQYPELIVEIEVAAGTYIRSIAHDLWEIIGSWWYLSALRRITVWRLNISQATKLRDLKKENSLDIYDIFKDKIVLFQDEKTYARLRNGQRVKGDFSFPQNMDIFLFDGKNIRYIIEYKKGVIHPRKKVA